jgi:hypothetical protein
VLDTAYAGTAFDAGAGPTTSRPSTPTAPGGSAPSAAKSPSGGSAPGTGAESAGGQSGETTDRRGTGSFAGLSHANVQTQLTSDERKLYDYVKARQHGAKFVLTANSWSIASPYILATGDTVMPMGGFSRSVPSPSYADFTAMVRDGQVRYVLIGAVGGIGGGSRGGGSDGGSGTQISTWVQKECTTVPSADYGVSETTGSTPAGNGTSGGTVPKGSGSSNGNGGGSAGGSPTAGGGGPGQGTGTLYLCGSS